MSNPKWPQQPPYPPQGDPGAPQNPFGAPPSQQGGAPPIQATQAMDFSQMPLPGAPGAPPQQPWGAPPAASQQGSPFGAPPPQQQPWGPPPSTSQQGSPFGAPPPQQPWGAPPSQQGFGAPPSQQGFGAPPSQPWGAAPQQNAYGAPPAYAPAPTPRPSTGGTAVFGLLAAGVLALGGVCAVGVARFRKKATRAVTSSVVPPPTTGLVPIPGRTTGARGPQYPDEQLQAKLDPYVEHCLNRFSRQVFDAENRYLDWVDRRKGPTGRERIVYGIYNVNGDPGECSRAVSGAVATQPSLPGVESAGLRYAGALNAVVPLIRQAHAYYSNPVTYRGDQMAQGRLLHPQLLAAFEQFSAAQRALSDEVGQNQDRATEALLARIQSDPNQVVEYHLKNDQRMARQLIRLTRGWDVNRRGELSGIDAAALAPAIDQYRVGLDNLRAAAVANPRQSSRIAGLSLYQLRGTSYLTQLQRLSTRLQTGERFTRTDLRLMGMRLGRAVQGSPEAVNNAYNELVQSYNALR